MSEEIVVKFRLLPWQVRAREMRKVRELVVVNTGIHTGKTVWGATELLDDMLQHPGETYWWVAGLKFHLDAWWDVFGLLARRVGGVVRSHPYYFVRLPNGARVYGVSAENVDAIASHHPAAIYGDEVAKWRQEAWHLIRARLLRKGGSRGLFLSSPRPNFWRDLVRWGREERDGRWCLIECTTYEAGLLTAEEIEAFRRDVPEEFFQQEILARIMDGAGMVFRRVRDAAAGKVEGPLPNERYVIGYDPAKVRDFAVAVVRNRKKIVCIERFQETSYTTQASLIAALSRRYNRASVIADATGPGQAVIELLEKEKLMVTAVTFDNQNKQEMVDKLAIRFEQGKIILPSAACGPAYAACVDELTAYERTMTGSGLRYSYSAPSGCHDDCCSALMLAFCEAETEPAMLTYMRWRVFERAREEPAFRLKYLQENPDRAAEYQEWLEKKERKERGEDAGDRDDED